MSNESSDNLTTEIMANSFARCAYKENTLRRRLAQAFEDARRASGMTVRTLAEKMDTSPSQVQRLLHREVGGSLTLRTIVRAADVLDLVIGVHVRPRDNRSSVVTQFGRMAWMPSDVGGVVRGASFGKTSAVVSTTASVENNSCWTDESSADLSIETKLSVGM